MEESGPVKRSPALRRYWPVAALVLAIALIYATGLNRYLSLQVVAEHRDTLKAFVASHLFWSMLIYALIYIAAVALSLPGAAFLTIIGGFLFGWMVGAPLSIGSATVGAIVVFEIVRSSFGAGLAERAGPFMKKLSDGFAKDAFNYLLFLRLVPAFPFFAVNAVAALTHVSRSTFALATLIGIIPAGIAFSWLGTGLDSVIDAQLAAHGECVARQGAAACELRVDASALVTPQLLAGLFALGVLALIPAIIRRFRSR